MLLNQNEKQTATAENVQRLASMSVILIMFNKE